MSTAIDALERKLNDRLSQSKTPGYRYVIANASTAFACHGGFADLAAQRQMLANTTMMAYSMSKTITAAAVLSWSG